MNIDDAVGDADLRVLLMSVFHLTGDRRWLAPPFVPHRDVQLIADERAGLSAELAQEIRAAAVKFAGREPVIDDPGDGLMVEMMGVCLGENVPPEYAPMMREELGFVTRDVECASDVQAHRGVLIIGAGVSGIAMGVRLDRMGIPYTIIEKRSDVGGVWRDNRYPGAGVDTPNHAYSFSFAPPNRWSRFFAPQAEIEEYIARTARDFGVLEHIEFDTAVRSLTWDESNQRWSVEIEGPAGTAIRSWSFVVSAIGQLNEPSVPEIDGVSDFRGMSFHSAQWPADLDVADKHLAIVGVGASAMQIVPSVIDRVGSLSIYQRSPQWARPIPRYHDPIPAGSQWLFDNMAHYAKWFRFTMLWRYGDGLLRHLRKDPEWPHPDRSLNRVNDRHREEMQSYLEGELADRPDLIERCLPNYPPYGKRILLDNGWYRALLRPNVELVVEPIDRLTTDGVVTADGEYRFADVVVFATGFSVSDMTARLNVSGRNGVRLDDVWAGDNPRAYLGITVPGFPNLFCMQGPNTGLGHGGSAIFQSECQARYITSALRAVLDAGVTALDVEPALHDAYVERVDREHEQLVWTHPGMSTYYRNSAGRVVSVMPWRLVDYWAMTHDARLADYRLTTSPSERESHGQ